MKIQPVDCNLEELSVPVVEPPKTAVKSLLKRLFERPFVRTSSEKVAGDEFEPSSVCLGEMVQNFIEGNSVKPTARCNWFNGISNGNGNGTGDNSEDESDVLSAGHGTTETCEVLRSLVACESVWERNLLADIAKIVHKNKIGKRKDGFCRKIVVEGLLGIGYDAAVSKCRWEKSFSLPAGEYEYIDVIMEEERIIVDVGFRSEFEIARSTRAYKSILDTLPNIFVGQTNRLEKIIRIVSEAATQSLKKKGMHIPPWRRGEYVQAKWLSPHTRIKQSPTLLTMPKLPSIYDEKKIQLPGPELGPNHDTMVEETELDEPMFAMSESSGEEEDTIEVIAEVNKFKEGLEIGVEMVTGFTPAVADQD